MEYIDITDEDNNLTGKKVEIREAHFESLWHRAAHIWIYNSKGEIFIQKRAAIKNYFADLYDTSAAGHIDSGEEPIDSAIRETKEELGLTVSKSDLDFLGIIRLSMSLHDYVNNEHYYVYLLKFDGKISDLILKKNEVSEMRLISLDDLRKEIDNPKTYKKYVQHNKSYYYKIINEVRKRLKNE